MNELHRLQGLYDPSFEKENCGFGLIAQMDDQPSHWLVQTAIQSLSRMTHRGGVAADCCTGDGCGLLLKKPDAFFRAEARDLNIAVVCSVGINTVKGPCVCSGYSVVADDMSAIGSVTRYKYRSALFRSSRTLYFAVLERAVLSAVEESDG